MGRWSSFSKAGGHVANNVADLIEDVVETAGDTATDLVETVGNAVEDGLYALDAVKSVRGRINARLSRAFVH